VSAAYVFKQSHGQVSVGDLMKQAFRLSAVIIAHAWLLSLLALACGQPRGNRLIIACHWRCFVKLVVPMFLLLQTILGKQRKGTTLTRIGMQQHATIVSTRWLDYSPLFTSNVNKLPPVLCWSSTT